MKKSSLTGAVVAVPLTLLFAATAGAQIVDQQQLLSNGAFGGLSEWSFQTFTPTSAQSAGAGFLIEAADPGEHVTISLFSGTPGSGITTLASGSATTTDQDAWVDAFWAPVSVTPGQLYWLGILGDGPNYGYTEMAQGDPYAGGEAYYNYSRDPDVATSCCGSTYDLTFREYSAASVTVTPEPATLSLVATGLIGLAGTVKRRNRRSATAE